MVSLRQDLIIRRQETLRARSGLAGARQEQDRARNEFAREVYDAPTEAETALVLRRQELRKAEERARLTVLRATEASVVQQFQIDSIGGVVQPAAPLMVMAPSGSELVLEARILSRDIGFVREGQAVEIKLEAYPFPRYGVVPGVLDHIGRDAVEDEDLGLVPGAHPAGAPLDRHRRPATGPDGGDVGDRGAEDGRRRIIEYLLSPLMRRVSEAGQER